MDTARVQIGVVIVYRLRPSDRPTNPQRLWHGRVKDVYNGACWVCSIEPEYENLEEIVFFHQIVGIEGGSEYELFTSL
ncbi:MAG: hypothetical protein ACJ8AG_18160 [Ktedonobacteraceae bacterium]